MCSLHHGLEGFGKAALVVRLKLACIGQLQFHRPLLEARHADLTGEACPYVSADPQKSHCVMGLRRLTRADVPYGLGALVQHNVRLHDEAHRREHRGVAVYVAAVVVLQQKTIICQQNPSVFNVKMRISQESSPAGSPLLAYSCTPTRATSEPSASCAHHLGSRAARG